MRKLFSIRDVKISEYAPPFVVECEASAMRLLHMAVRDKDSRIHQFPEDFQLVQLGEYDEITGHLIPRETPKFLMHALTCRAHDIKNGYYQPPSTPVGAPEHMGVEETPLVIPEVFEVKKSSGIENNQTAEEGREHAGGFVSPSEGLNYQTPKE